MNLEWKKMQQCVKLATICLTLKNIITKHNIVKEVLIVSPNEVVKVIFAVIRTLSDRFLHSLSLAS